MTPCLAPPGELGAALVQDEVGDLRDQAHLLGDRDELLRRDEPLLRVVPTAQGLHVRDVAGPDVPDRLVHQAELRPGLERVRQEATEHEPALHALVVLDRVHLHRAAVLLGHVHGDVGPLQQQGNVVTVLGCHGDAGAGGDGQREAVHFDRTLHLDVELVHNLDGALRIGHVRDDEGELVAAESGHGGAARDGAEEALGDFAQQPVTDGVTECVVDVLEAVDVEQHDRHPAAVAQGLRSRVRKRIRFGSPVSMSWVAWCDLESTS